MMKLTVFSCGAMSAVLLLGDGREAVAAKVNACEELGPQKLERSAVRRGQGAPGFELTDIDGKRWSLRSLRGRPVLLNFWATWCAPCREELLALERLRARLGSKLVVLTVSVDETRDVVRNFFPKGTKLPVLLDSDKAVAKLFGTEKFPETFLIDSAGVVQELFHQAPWGAPAATRCLQALR